MDDATVHHDHAGDPFARAGKRADIFTRLLAAGDCERCGALAAQETDYGVPLCEGCANVRSK